MAMPSPSLRAIVWEPAAIIFWRWACSDRPRQLFARGESAVSAMIEMHPAGAARPA